VKLGGGAGAGARAGPSEAGETGAVSVARKGCSVLISSGDEDEESGSGLTGIGPDGAGLVGSSSSDSGLGSMYMSSTLTVGKGNGSAIFGSWVGLSCTGN
jgi:hypothetical protein